MSLLNKLQKNSTIKETSLLSESILFNEKDVIPTDVLAINIALSGDVNGGVTPGVTTIAGPSRHFKTLFSLICAKAYLDKYEDAVLLFYDSEFGSPQSYFENVGISTKRVIHSPVTCIEDLRHDFSVQLENLSRNDKVFIIADSVGGLASKKEVDDAISGKESADLTRAKILKSFFRIITPKLTLKDIPFFAIAHVYKTLELYSKDVVSGGTGIMLGSDNVWIITRAQEKKDTELLGYTYTINVEKSRYTKEKSKVPISVTFEGGVNKYSGLLELALESGDVVKPNMGWYALVDDKTGEISDKKYRQKDTDSDEFLGSVLARESFRTFIKNKYQLNSGKPNNLIDNESGE